jgi:hypothetical protein
MTTKPLKKETKQQRVKKHAELIYARIMAALSDGIAKLPREQAPTPQKMKELASNRVNLAIESAAIFDDMWQAQKGRFIEDAE